MAWKEDTMIQTLTDPKIRHSDHALKGRIDGILNRHPAVGLAVGVVRDRRLELFSGHGLADIAATTPMTEDTVFRIGSITKTFTAIAVLQLWEQGLVDLDAPANDYLRAYRLIPAKATHRPATPRQLLTHSAGLPQLVHPWRAYTPILGQTVRFGQQLPTLAEYYGGRLQLVAEPGTTHAGTVARRPCATAAAARRSSSRLFVQEPMNTRSTTMSVSGIPAVRPM